jgi:hypothetical protein
MIRYIELKSGYHDDGPAWIARVVVSKSGRTVYFNGKALKRSTQAGSGNYYDVETAESYWERTSSERLLHHQSWTRAGMEVATGIRHAT